MLDRHSFLDIERVAGMPTPDNRTWARRAARVDELATLLRITRPCELSLAGIFAAE